MKRNLRKVLSIGILAGTLLLSACGGGKAATDDNVFRVGMECGYAPYNWTQLDDSNGAVPIEGSKEFANGYDVLMAKKIAEGLGKELRIVKTEWAGLSPAVQSGVIDGILAGMSPTAERKESIDFSDPYWKSNLIIVVKKDSPYVEAKNLNDFSGATITGQLNTVHYDVVDQIPGVNKSEAMKDFNAERVALKSGIIDGYVAEIPEGLSVVEAIPEFTYVEFDEGQGFEVSDEDIAVSVGLKKGSDLTEKINEILKGISADERQEMMKEALSTQPITEE